MRYICLLGFAMVLLTSCAAPALTPKPTDDVNNYILLETFTPEPTRENISLPPPIQTATTTPSPTNTLAITSTFTPTPQPIPSNTDEPHMEGTPVRLFDCFSDQGIWVEVFARKSSNPVSRCFAVNRQENTSFSFTIYFDKDNANGENLETFYLGDLEGDFSYLYATFKTFADFKPGHYALWGDCDDKCEFKVRMSFNDYVIDQYEVISYEEGYCHDFDITYYEFPNAEVTVDYADDLGGGALVTTNYEFGKTCEQIKNEQD